MKKLLPFVLALTPLFAIEEAILGAKALRPAPMATCSGTTPCTACTTCSSCYNCHVKGGLCGAGWNKKP